MKRAALVLPLAILFFWAWCSLRAPALPTPAAVASTAPASPIVNVTKPAAAKTVAAPLAPPSQGSPTMTNRPFPYQKELTSYVFLRQKIFLTDAEKVQRGELLRHRDLLRALGARLREATRSPAIMQEQDTAIDLLIEAARAGDDAVAREILSDVVRDAQIEDAALARPVREQLAGLKAEVLYQWSAVQPEADIVSLLPGPVSKKIWANVLAMQESNRAESLATAERDHARGGYGLRDENDGGH